MVVTAAKVVVVVVVAVAFVVVVGTGVRGTDVVTVGIIEHDISAHTQFDVAGLLEQMMQL